MFLLENQFFVFGCVWLMAFATINLFAAEAKVLLFEAGILTVMTAQT
jgi:hypothetical protein